MASSAAKKKSDPKSQKRRVVVLTKKEKEAPPPQPDVSLVREGVAFLLFIVGVFLTFAIASTFRAQLIPGGPLASFSGQSLAPNTMGPVGAAVSSTLVFLLGWCAWVAPIWAFLLGHSVWSGSFPKKESRHTILLTVLGSVVMAVSAATAFSVFHELAGGYLGTKISSKLIPSLNSAGTVLISFSGFILSLGMATGLQTATLVKVARRLAVGLQRSARTTWGVSAKSATVVGKANVAAGRMLFSSLGRGVRTSLSASEAVFRRPDNVRRDPIFHSSPVVEPIIAPVKQPVLIEHRRSPAPDEIAVNEPEREEDEEEQEIQEPPRVLKISRNVSTEATDDDDETEEDEDDEVKPRSLRRKLQQRLKSRHRGREKNADKGKRSAREEVDDEEDESALLDDSFELPSLELLVKPDESGTLGPKDDELFANCRQLEKTLLDFRIGGKVVEVHPGPVITLYQFEPAPGIKVQRIIGLADDLALSLKVASVRVYAPVPGKGTVGIEVPNMQREIVRLREVLDSEPWRAESSPLSLALGKDTFGEPYVADLAKMPHLLIAGATGTGKSVCINSLLLSLLFRSSPRDLRLILIDPKMLELSVYENIPHLKAPVVTNPKRARGVLWWAVEEMERRYNAMKDLGVRSLDSYNRVAMGGSLDELGGPSSKETGIIELEERDVVAAADERSRLDRGGPEEKRRIIAAPKSNIEYLPRIVIVVDELADLMLTVGREIEELLTRLAQKARAAGIHLILATQRPSVNVITGLIKANFPARISFKVASRIDARTVLDMSGAERLLGQGDMLFLPPGTSKVRRVHSAFVSDKEVHDAVHWLRSQGAPDYDPQIEQMIEKLEESEKAGGDVGGADFEYDPLYDQAVNLVLEKGQASTSMIQRVFRIGYNRAARILETMEREGLIGPADGAKPRQVLVPGGRANA